MVYMRNQVANFGWWYEFDEIWMWMWTKKIWRMIRDHWGALKLQLIKEDLMVWNRDMESKNSVASYSGHFIVAF